MAKKNLVAMKAEFPLYCLSMVGDRHLLVAGGGGSAKSGIPNAIDIYELKYDNRMMVLHRVNHYETKSRAVMNCAVVKRDKNFSLAVGLDNSCMLFSLRYKLMVPKIENEVLEGVRKRKNNLTNSTNHNTATKMIGFEIEAGDEVVSDHAKDGGYQKVVRMCADMNSVVTAGAEGVLRCWELSTLNMRYEVKAHTGDIDDLDISPDGKYIVSISKEGGCVWELQDGTKVATLQPNHNLATSHRLRNSRFSKVTDKDKSYVLYTTYIPRMRGGQARHRSTHNGLIRWDCRKFVPVKQLSTGSECISAFAVSDDGMLLAVATMEGTVSVFVSFSLQRLYHTPHAHNIFVTGLEFSPSSSLAVAVTGHKDFTLFSISADNYIKVHQQEPEAMYSVFWILIGSMLLIFLIFWITSSSQLLLSS